MSTYPEHIPPEPPTGMKWEYRGKGWDPQKKVTYYLINSMKFASDVIKDRMPDGLDKIDYFEAVPDVTSEVEDVLEEALRLTSGDRQNQYGPPDQDFARTAAMWTALFGHKFEARDVAMAMICLKLSRETHQKKRDNVVDGAGYFRCLHLCNEAEKNRHQHKTVMSNSSHNA